jgi:hypothetical protein
MAGNRRAQGPTTVTPQMGSVDHSCSSASSSRLSRWPALVQVSADCSRLDATAGRCYRIAPRLAVASLPTDSSLRFVAAAFFACTAPRRDPTTAWESSRMRALARISWYGERQLWP